ncbi:hypothetical protein TTHERM_000649479 (macronuclear) [Tetrahymena thermophila SB210]|uniref:Uncharacterized protein n=1 Tax=Tetrahymena thermophila (strain SB210) TaxID=312017 RepID=W7XI39_TETTS|nr:hypothetical protein TTHERM_000649479 [Tetrahymena thermophila SB210]EWS74296.1 hypothetical protein TTHERM_000649479 [Tetrahymena thermophila SB210]|eukprot:XP_012653184.1 hypothetical protein TTHERM_000649479 [Tetrahymena thermophila SB210]
MDFLKIMNLQIQKETLKTSQHASLKSSWFRLFQAKKFLHINQYLSVLVMARIFYQYSYCFFQLTNKLNLINQLFFKSDQISQSILNKRAFQMYLNQFQMNPFNFLFLAKKANTNSSNSFYLNGQITYLHKIK